MSTETATSTSPSNGKRRLSFESKFTLEGLIMIASLAGFIFGPYLAHDRKIEANTIAIAGTQKGMDKMEAAVTRLIENQNLMLMQQVEIKTMVKDLEKKPR